MKKKDGDMLRTLIWGIRLALQIDRRTLFMWLLISAAISVLPAVALQYNQAILDGLSRFLLTGVDTHAYVIANIIYYVLLLTIIGLTTRYNDDMLYMVMFDSYYLGLEEVMMDSAQKIPLSVLMHKQVGSDYFAAISRCGALTDLTSSGCMLISKLVSIVSLLIVAIAVSPTIALFAFVYIVLAFVLNGMFASKIQVVWSQMRDDMRRADYLEKLVREPDPAKEIRLYGSLSKTIAEWKEAYQKVEDTVVRQASGIAQLTFYLRVGFLLFLLCVMVNAIGGVSAGTIMPAQALMLFALCLNLSDTISALPKSYQRVSYGLYGLSIQRTFFETAAQMDPSSQEDETIECPDENIETIFEAKDLTFAYQDGKNVLDGISFRIQSGKSIALVGANGSGKTTLIKLLLGLYAPTGGELLYNGKPYTKATTTALSENVGAFFQDYYLFHLTVAENVGSGDVKNIDNRELVKKAIEEGGAAHIVSRLPQNMDNLLGVHVYKTGAVLSGGESQRIAVSRAFMSRKELLVFDEPASMLDPIAELNQFESIQEKVREHTSILVSHRIGFARLADSIFVLDGGRLVEMGSHDELLEKQGVYAKLFAEQAQWYTQEEVGA